MRRCLVCSTVRTCKTQDFNNTPHGSLPAFTEPHFAVRCAAAIPLATSRRDWSWSGGTAKPLEGIRVLPHREAVRVLYGGPRRFQTAQSTGWCAKKLQIVGSNHLSLRPSNSSSGGSGRDTHTLDEKKSLLNQHLGSWSVGFLARWSLHV